MLDICSSKRKAKVPVRRVIVATMSAQSAMQRRATVKKKTILHAIHTRTHTTKRAIPVFRIFTINVTRQSAMWTLTTARSGSSC